MEYTNEQLDVLFQKLPDRLQDYIMSEETLIDMEDIALRNQVNHPELLKKFVFHMIVGTWSAEDFIRSLEYKLRIPEQRGEQIYEDVVEKILVNTWKIADEEINVKEKTPQQPSIQPQAQPPVPTVVTLPQKTEEEVYDLSHDKLLEQIAHPTPNLATPPSYLDNKLSTSASLPKEEVKIDQYSGSDPYREPPAA